MSLKENDIYIENLIETYEELAMSWNGKSLSHEQKLQDCAGELEELGIDVDKLDERIKNG